MFGPPLSTVPNLAIEHRAFDGFGAQKNFALSRGITSVSRSLCHVLWCANPAFPRRPMRHNVFTARQVVGDNKYCTEFVLEGATCSVHDLRHHLEPRGESLLVIGAASHIGVVVIGGLVLGAWGMWRLVTATGRGSRPPG